MRQVLGEGQGTALAVLRRGLAGESAGGGEPSDPPALPRLPHHGLTFSHPKNCSDHPAEAEGAVPRAPSRRQLPPRRPPSSRPGWDGRPPCPSGSRQPGAPGRGSRELTRPQRSPAWLAGPANPSPVPASALAGDPRTSAPPPPPGGPLSPADRDTGAAARSGPARPLPRQPLLLT